MRGRRVWIDEDVRFAEVVALSQRNVNFDRVIVAVTKVGQASLPIWVYLGYAVVLGDWPDRRVRG